MKKLGLVAFAFMGMVAIMSSCSKGNSTNTTTIKQDSVIHSPWITLSMSIIGTQANTSGGTDTFYRQTITAPSITQRILDSGVVLTYLSFIDNTGATNMVSASPYFNPELILLGQIQLNSTNVDWSTYSFRYVVIPGSVLSTNSVLKGLTKAQLKAADYSVIANAVGLSKSSTN